MENNVIELSVNIEFCPYCGENNLTIENEDSLTCEECGRDFTVMTHE